MWARPSSRPDCRSALCRGILRAAPATATLRPRYPSPAPVSRRCPPVSEWLRRPTRQGPHCNQRGDRVARAHPCRFERAGRWGSSAADEKAKPCATAVNIGVTCSSVSGTTSAVNAPCQAADPEREQVLHRPRPGRSTRRVRHETHRIKHGPEARAPPLNTTQREHC